MIIVSHSFFDWDWIQFGIAMFNWLLAWELGMWHQRRKDRKALERQVLEHYVRSSGMKRFTVD